MELAGKVAVVTGGAAGIGRALCRRFAREGARVVVSDVDAPGAARAALEVEGLAVAADVSVEADVIGLVETVLTAYGHVDLFCSNAGILRGSDAENPAAAIGLEAPDDDWERLWRVNVMSHVYVGRAVLPPMQARGEGHLLLTASAAGLLTMIGNAPYTATKHAVVGLAEWLAVTYGDDGIRLSCLCPEVVRTGMTAGLEEHQLPAQAIDPEAVAEAVVEGLRQERFLILPHPQVAEYVRRKADDHDRWLLGMRRLRARG